MRDSGRVRNGEGVHRPTSQRSLQQDEHWSEAEARSAGTRVQGPVHFERGVQRKRVPQVQAHCE